ncbi:hypothetical protein DVS28_b0003 (plasmid) [Euzebya pacifica]|uniref:Uncharacterized protein n=1 Tax=Euzebya pacifica TaxID=1608957 RepID=A0A346Y5M6_9ACTN|nr:hypothetical protein [Euzebya pacifica]AXV09773.1 hypothetical protein DVS28_b0003 [Euzebya pacifica]
MPSPDGSIAYEADVVDAVAVHLTGLGWAEKARAATTAHGVDLLLRAGRLSVAVEAKGAGSSQEHTARFGLPFTGGQVADHVAMAVATALRVASAGEHLAAIALPDDDQHRRHVGTLLAAITTAGITVLWARPDGTVRQEGAALPDPTSGRQQTIVLPDGTVEIVEYDDDGEVLRRTYGTVEPDDQTDDARLLEESAAMHADDWIKTGRWDIRDSDHETVQTVSDLAATLGWGRDQKAELRAFMLLPAFRAAPATLRHNIKDLLVGTPPRTAPSPLELVVLAHRHDEELLGAALLRFPWADGPVIPPYTGGGWDAYLATNQPPQDTPGALVRHARAWGVPDRVVKRMRTAFRAAGRKVEEAHVIVQTASDHDGITHAVAVTDDVDGWTVLVSSNGHERPAVGPLPFSSGYPGPLTGKPSWAVDPADSWRVLIDGNPVPTRWDLPAEHQTHPADG